MRAGIKGCGLGRQISEICIVCTEGKETRTVSVPSTRRNATADTQKVEGDLLEF